MIALSLGAPEQFGRGVCYPMLDLDGEESLSNGFLGDGKDTFGRFGSVCVVGCRCVTPFFSRILHFEVRGKSYFQLTHELTVKKGLLLTLAQKPAFSVVFHPSSSSCKSEKSL